MKRKTTIRILLVVLGLCLIFFPSRVFQQTPEIPVEVQQDTRASDIDQYYRERSMPLAGYGAKFVEEADKNGIDYRLLAAIAVKESSGGKHLIPGSYNAFGWGSGTIKFTSYDHAISYISAKLGKGKYYAGKTTDQKLKTYNPPTVEKEYSARVQAIMEMF